MTAVSEIMFIINFCLVHGFVFSTFGMRILAGGIFSEFYSQFHLVHLIMTILNIYGLWVAISTIFNIISKLSLRGVGTTPGALVLHANMYGLK